MNRNIETAAAKLDLLRKQSEVAEADLQKVVGEYLGQRHGSMREMARELGVSAAYLCDIRHGRRKISAAFLDRLRGAK